MKPALLLIDLQHDYLRAPGLYPAAGAVVERAAALLEGCRSLSIPVFHVWTTVRRDDDHRMPHWRDRDYWACVEGTEGHATPATLTPLPGEPLIHKTFFSAFGDDTLHRRLEGLPVDLLLLAGVHLHACVRATVLDAYQLGYKIWVAEDAVGSDDPVHAAGTQRHLEQRCARFLPVERLLNELRSAAAPASASAGPLPRLPAAIVAGEALPAAGLPVVTHASPCSHFSPLWEVPVAGPGEVARACHAARRAAADWRATDVAGRRALLEQLAARIEADQDRFARQMAIEIGKPVRQGRAEAVRAAALLRATAQAADPEEEETGPGVVGRRRPVGVIGVVTPWNNPLAIPVGKLAPALLYGNTVAWKPAPAGSAVALKLMALLHEAGCPPGVINLVCGDRSTADALMSADLDAVTLSGSLGAGYAAGEICGRRHLPLQAELGGNNAAIVWSDADLVPVADQLAEAAFGFAGQRCTANRRVIVEAGCADTFVEALVAATARLVWGDPLDEATQVGPLISRSARDRVASLVARAETSGHAVLVPHRGSARPAPRPEEGAYYPPTLVLCDDPGHEIVQEETFGPVLVVQRADGWREALDLCSGVRQGLVAALFSGSPERQAEFLEEARAGVLKINRPTTDVDAVSPFGGWKASGVGPPEHSEGDRQFYTRLQSVYR